MYTTKCASYGAIEIKPTFRDIHQVLKNVIFGDLGQETIKVFRRKKKIYVCYSRHDIANKRRNRGIQLHFINYICGAIQDLP